MPRCAFLTLENVADFCIQDHLLFEPMARVGWQVEEVPWTRPQVDWSVFDAVIIRSTWDYQEQADVFLATLDIIESRSALYNPLPICRWNLHKTYLRDLERNGVPIVPTLWKRRLDEREIGDAIEHFSAGRLIAKPLIGANADDTFVLSRDDPATWRDAIRCFATREVMLQPFLESVLDEGEYSLFYFGGVYSHSIRKVPARGDYRVQEEHGGVITPVDANPGLQATAQAALAIVPATLLYARVDLVLAPSGGAVVMELELIEPSLYLAQCATAADSFVRAFLSMREQR